MDLGAESEVVKAYNNIKGENTKETEDKYQERAAKLKIELDKIKPPAQGTKADEFWDKEGQRLNLATVQKITVQQTAETVKKTPNATATETEIAAAQAAKTKLDTLIANIPKRINNAKFKTYLLKLNSDATQATFPNKLANDTPRQQKQGYENLFKQIEDEINKFNFLTFTVKIQCLNAEEEVRTSGKSSNIEHLQAIITNYLNNPAWHPNYDRDDNLNRLLNCVSGKGLYIIPSTNEPINYEYKFENNIATVTIQRKAAPSDDGGAGREGGGGRS